MIKKKRFYICIFLVFITFVLNAQDVYRIRKVDFNGNKTLNAKDLMAKMNTHPKKGLEKVLVWKKRDFTYAFSWF